MSLFDSRNARIKTTLYYILTHGKPIWSSESTKEENVSALGPLLLGSRRDNTICETMVGHLVAWGLGNRNTWTNTWLQRKSRYKIPRLFREKYVLPHQQLRYYPPCLCRRAQTWRSHAKLYKFGWHTSASSARMKNSRDLFLGEVVYIAIICHIPDSWIYLLNVYDF